MYNNLEPPVPPPHTTKAHKHKQRDSELLQQQVGEGQEMSIDEEKKHTLELDAKKCPCSFVTVFSDRAEVTRNVEVELEQGTTQITISGVSNKIERNSVRVAGARGRATILEVSTNTNFVKNTKQSKSQQITDQLEDLRRQEASLKELIGRIQSESKLLEAWANKTATPLVNKDGERLVDMCSDESIKNVINFLDYYDKKLEDIDHRLESANDNLRAVTKERTKLENELQQLPTVVSDDTVQEILIDVFCKAPTGLELQVAYLVSGARWSASYDVRVISGEDQLDIIYYGNITNDTEEEWSNTNLALSTAQPSVAGKPPELTTKVVRYLPPYSTRFYGTKYEYSANVMVQTSVQNRVVSSYPRSGPSSQPTSTTTAVNSTMSTTFMVPRKAAILADNKPHKVTIQQIKMNTNFTYTIIPKLSPHAYLKANIVNNNCQFLPGPMNVFMDNNFVAKSEIPAIALNESLGIFLGVDAAIKFEYQPLKQLTATQGLLQKTNALTVKYNTVITNNKNKEVVVIMFDQLPKSTDSLVKVKLVEPVVQQQQQQPQQQETIHNDISITPANNLMWTMVLQSGEKKNVPFSYVVDFPLDRTVEGAY